MAPAEVVAHPDAQAAVFGRAEQAFDTAQAVVASGGALFFHAQGTQRKCYVVHDNEQVLQRHFLRLQPVAHSLAAEVHVSRRLEQRDDVVLEPEFSYCTVPLYRKNSIGCLSEGIQCHKSHIVTGHRVF